MPSPVQLLRNVPNFTHQAYRYGIALSCIGVLLNWLGVAQAYIEPVRYIGVGLVIIGSFLIIAAMCRWMFHSPHPSTVREVTSDATGDLHVITVPMGRSQGHSRTPGTSTASHGKPPDYFLVTEKPPSYEEAMSMLPLYLGTRSGSLRLNTEGGLEDFLVPHQVPESQPEGATGGSLQHLNNRVDTGDLEESESLFGPLSAPPAYSSQISLCASLSTNGSGNNNSSPLDDVNHSFDTSTYIQAETEQILSSAVHLSDFETIEQTPESNDLCEKSPNNKKPSSLGDGTDK